MGTPPTLQDFREELLKQNEPEAQEIALAIELFTDGSLNTFAKHTNVDTHSRLICYDILDLGKQLQPMFDFKTDCIEPEGMHGGWQTSGTVKVCHLAFNLWNGYAEEGRERYFTPEELFCCEFAPYFMEGIKVRYPEYCRDLPSPKKQTEHTR